jgi:glycosyltransferase involved in cell wall biosynthesis
MAKGKPLVSIGMPVYNGEPHIRQALDSLLAQEYENFELIISDNASTDRTQEICLEYVARDKRIRYYRNQMNMGAVWNFNRVFELLLGEYFMWASHDDYWHPRYLRSCLKGFRISQDIVLVGTQCEIIDPETEEVIWTDQGFSTIGLSPAGRFKSTALAGRPVNIFYGVYKRNALCEVMPLRKVPAPAKLLLEELCLNGDFLTVPQRLMTKRYGGASAVPRKSPTSYTVAQNISNPLFRRFNLFGWQVLTQKIIFQTDRFTVLGKVRLSCWSFSGYVSICGISILAIIYRMLLVLWPRAAMRARELWRSAAQGSSR